MSLSGGHKDALCYKFRRFTIGQNCSAVCANKGGHRGAFLNKRTAQSAAHFMRPAKQATEPRAKQEARLFFIMPVDSLVGDTCRYLC